MGFLFCHKLSEMLSHTCQSKKMGIEWNQLKLDLNEKIEEKENIDGKSSHFKKGVNIFTIKIYPIEKFFRWASNFFYNNKRWASKDN